MNVLFIVNDPPYGTERSYNALRLARTLLKRDGVTMRMFLLGDAVADAKSGQKVAAGYYNLADMVKMLLHAGGEVGLCGTCMDARGIQATECVEGAKRSTMEELADWTLWADKVLTF